MPSASANQKLTVSASTPLLGREDNGDVHCLHQPDGRGPCGRRLVASRGKVICPKCKTEHTLLNLLVNQIGPRTREVRGVTEWLLRTSWLARAQAGAASLGEKVLPSEWLLKHTWLIIRYGFVPVYLIQEKCWVLLWTNYQDSDGADRFLQFCRQDKYRSGGFWLTANEARSLIAWLNEETRKQGNRDPQSAVFTIAKSESYWRELHLGLSAVMQYDEEPKHRRAWTTDTREWVWIDDRFQIISAGAVINPKPDPEHDCAHLRLIVKQPPEQPLVP